MITFFKHPIKSYRNHFALKNEPQEMKILPEVILNIFSHLKFENFESCFLVSKKWNELAKPFVKRAIFQNFVFNPDHWNHYFGEGTVTKEETKKAFELLPDNIWAILNTACPEFPYNRIMDTHILIWLPEAINEKKLTLNNFGQLLNEIRPEFTDKWNKTYLVGILYNKIISSGYVMMLKEAIPGSKRHSYNYQENHFKFLNGLEYQIPKFEEAAICIYAEHLKSGDFIFESSINFSKELGMHKVDNFISCKNGMVIGNFDKNGLTIKQGKAVHPNRRIGAAPLVRLKPSEYKSPVI